MGYLKLIGLLGGAGALIGAWFWFQMGGL